MEVFHPRCAGLDMHKDIVVAAVRLAEGGTARTEIRKFETTTPGLLARSAWLGEARCSHVGMEATGVYLEAGLARAVGRRFHAQGRTRSRGRAF